MQRKCNEVEKRMENGKKEMKELQELASALEEEINELEILKMSDWKKNWLCVIVFYVFFP